jgi:AraC-like DNA-binding protein/mannose-6-phosphate isomerase-like protein (cupin superfamily)
VKTKASIPIHGFNKEFPFELNKLNAAMMDNFDVARNPHRHSYYEIFFFYKGGGRHTIDFKEYEIESNSLHFISPGQVHTITRAKGCHGYVITFPEELYAIHGQQQFLQHVTLYHNYTDSTMISCTPAEMEKFKKLIAQIEEEYVTDGIMREELVRSYLNIILIHSTRIFRRNEKGSSIPSTGSTYIVQRFRQLLDENFLKVQAVNEYAGMLSITPSHLNDTVKKVTGSTVSSHIHERVILEAKRLLFNTKNSVKEVAFTLGFDDPTYFGRFFRKFTGMTPGEFREKF